MVTFSPTKLHTRVRVPAAASGRPASQSAGWWNSDISLSKGKQAERNSYTSGIWPMKTQANSLEKCLHVRGSSRKAAQADTQDKKLEITYTKYNIRKYEDNLIIKIK